MRSEASWASAFARPRAHPATTEGRKSFAAGLMRSIFESERQNKLDEVLDIGFGDGEWFILGETVFAVFQEA